MAILSVNLTDGQTVVLIVGIILVVLVIGGLLILIDRHNMNKDK